MYWLFGYILYWDQIMYNNELGRKVNCKSKLTSTVDCWPRKPKFILQFTCTWSNVIALLIRFISHARFLLATMWMHQSFTVNWVDIYSQMRLSMQSYVPNLINYYVLNFLSTAVIVNYRSYCHFVIKQLHFLHVIFLISSTIMSWIS